MKLLYTFLLILLVSSPANAQLILAEYPLASRNFDVKSMALGNAVVSLSGEDGNPFINPAGIGIAGTLQLIPAVSILSRPIVNEFRYSGVGANYKYGRSAFSVNVQLIESRDIYSLDQLHLIQFIGSNDINTRLHYALYTRLNYAYSFNSRLRGGISLNYLFNSESSGSALSEQRFFETNNLTIDLGMLYGFSFNVRNTTLQPGFGLSLTNFGNMVEYENREDKVDALPTKLQAGGGVTIIPDVSYSGWNIFEITALLNASKYLIRSERVTTENGLDYRTMSSFEALLNFWSGYDYFDGQQIINVTPADQIWIHSGLEINLLEILAFRWGYERAALDASSLTNQSVGVGLDLFYVSIDWTHIIDHPDRVNYLEGNWWQITGRIPLGREKPDTIWKSVF